MVALAEHSTEVDVASLPVEKQRELFARLNFLLNPAGGPQSSLDADSSSSDKDLRLVHDAFVLVMERNGERNRLPLDVLLKTKVGPRFRRNARIILDFVNEVFAPSRRVERQKILRILIHLMVKDIQDSGRPFCVNTLTNWMGRVRQVVDRHYPGYRESGLLPILLTRDASHRSTED